MSCNTKIQYSSFLIHIVSYRIIRITTLAPAPPTGRCDTDPKRHDQRKPPKSKLQPAAAAAAPPPKTNQCSETNNSRWWTVEDVAKETAELCSLAKRHRTRLKVRHDPLRVHGLIRVPSPGPAAIEKIKIKELTYIYIYLVKTKYVTKNNTHTMLLARIQNTTNKKYILVQQRPTTAVQNERNGSFMNEVIWHEWMGSSRES